MVKGYRTLEEVAIGLDSCVHKALLGEGGFVLRLEIGVGFGEVHGRG